MFLVFAYRDFKVRYAQTFLGFAWSFIQPAATLLIFTIVFSKAAKVDTGEVPYPLFAITGMSAWTYFAFVMGQSGNSIINAQSMVKKIYFPRLIIPLSKALVGLMDFAIVSVFLFGVFVFYSIYPSIKIVYLPLFLVLTLITSLGVGVWLSALTIRYRDFQHIIPFMVQFGLYATPIGYPSELLTGNIPPWFEVLYYFNPMVGIVEGFRWCLFETQELDSLSFVSYGVGIFIFVSGIYYFRKIEKIIADIV